jgi:putative transposase
MSDRSSDDFGFHRRVIASLALAIALHWISHNARSPWRVGASTQGGRIAMTLPREVVPGEFYMVSRRCTQRQFLLRPDPETNNAFTYCLADAANRYGVEVLLPVAMSNHHHTVIFDRHGTVPEFNEHFHKMLAKCQNALRGRFENHWSSEQVNVVRLVDRADVIRKLVYAATNPVKDRLVERVHHWPGVDGLFALLSQQPMRARRPKHFFRANGPMPEEVTLHLKVPAELGDPDQLFQELRKQVAAVENAVALERARTGARVLGRRGVLRQSWRDSPATPAPHRGLRPTIAARSVWSRIEAILRNREFLAAYRAARQRLSAGEAAIFPPGTYWLRRFANVPIAS